MAEMTASLARSVLNGGGVTRHELEQLCRFFLAHQPRADRNDEALRACPFCGSAAKFVEVMDLEGNRLDAVGCEACGACGPSHIAIMDDARPAAAASWNRRPAPSEAMDGEVRCDVCKQPTMHAGAVCYACTQAILAARAGQPSAHDREGE